MYLKPLTAAFALAATVPASAALIGDFRLDGTVRNEVGGPLTLINNGGTFDATTLTFPTNKGPTIAGFSSPKAYSIEFRFEFDNTGTYRKLADFLNKAKETGLYVHDNKLFFFNDKESATPVFTANQFATVVFTRAESGAAAGYVNGAEVIRFSNAADTALQSQLLLFQDDGRSAPEHSAGTVDYIRIYDTALSAAEVAGLTAPGPVSPVPEPATWAMMIAGFGLAGAAARRRGRAPALA